MQVASLHILSSWIASRENKPNYYLFTYLPIHLFIFERLFFTLSFCGKVLWISDPRSFSWCASVCWCFFLSLQRIRRKWEERSVISFAIMLEVMCTIVRLHAKAHAGMHARSCTYTHTHTLTHLLTHLWPVSVCEYLRTSSKVFCNGQKRKCADMSKGRSQHLI